ncbi:hypothetical protein THAOC_00780, partial [Thalassiosira oceanica]
RTILISGAGYSLVLFHLKRIELPRNDVVPTSSNAKSRSAVVTLSVTLLNIVDLRSSLKLVVGRRDGGLEVAVAAVRVEGVRFPPLPVPREDLRVPAQEGRLLPPRPPRVDPAGRQKHVPKRGKAARKPVRGKQRQSKDGGRQLRPPALVTVRIVPHEPPPESTARGTLRPPSRGGGGFQTPVAGRGEASLTLGEVAARAC